MDRVSWLLQHARAGSRILEIGPSYSPVAPKAGGWNSFVVDHAPRDELVAKYTALGTDATQIEEVDFVWRGGPLHEAVPAAQAGSFDLLIASHVIEHIPDFVGFFDSAERLLAAGGVVSLAVPDRRHCFDFFKPPTTTGDVLEAREQRRTRHARRTEYNQLAYSVAHGGRTSWVPEPVPDLAFCASFEAVAGSWAEAAAAQGAEQPYVDCHAWQFTPAWFRLILLELGELGLCTWRIDRLQSAGGEFLCLLRRGVVRSADPVQFQRQRMQLLREGLAETGEQIRFALGRMPSEAAAGNWGALHLLQGAL